MFYSTSNFSEGTDVKHINIYQDNSKTINEGKDRGGRIMYQNHIIKQVKMQINNRGEGMVKRKLVWMNLSIIMLSEISQRKTNTL